MLHKSILFIFTLLVIFFSCTSYAFGNMEHEEAKTNNTLWKNISSSVWENYSNVNWVMSEHDLMRLRNASDNHTNVNDNSDNNTEEMIIVRSEPYDESDCIDYYSPIVLKIVNGPRIFNENGTITYLNRSEDFSKVTLYPVKRSLYVDTRYQTTIVLRPAEYGSRLRNCCFGSIFKAKLYC